ncbi:sensor histidine kinase [Streptomyces sp. NBC_01716]|uniref:sensor histidine kinase n=1 Tax=Streptomyces sp. NBC_01716 TaxID=2975917 RepID=UPI002E3016C5|nr:sensor histidine kinase [Streptomyces sp. NBC_01716]
MDIALILGLLAFSVAGTVFSSFVLDQQLAIWPGVLQSAIGCAALLWRRSHPRTVVAVNALCAAVDASLGYLLTPLLQGPLMAALYSLGLFTDRKNTRIGAVLTAALLVATALVVNPSHHNLLLATLNPVAWVFLPAVLGTAVQLRRDYVAAVRARAEDAEQTREEEARRRVAQERIRIARELHDVVAHHLALANAQAGTAAHLVRVHSDQAGAMLDSLKETTASALREMKATVGLLRQDNESEPLGPAPGLDQLEELMAAFATAGLTVRIEIEGEARPLPPGADLSAYRIVQEALTNVTKHAATTTAHVRLVYSADRLTLTISNDGVSVSVAPPSGRGFGLIGMQERAHSAGGTLHAGPRPEGGFEVTCTLPLPPHHTTDSQKEAERHDHRPARRRPGPPSGHLPYPHRHHP